MEFDTQIASEEEAKIAEESSVVETSPHDTQIASEEEAKISEESSVVETSPQGIGVPPSPHVAIQFCSDTHMEMPLETRRFGMHLAQCYERTATLTGAAKEVELLTDSNKLPRCAPYLALLGDIFDGKKIGNGAYREYLRQQAQGYKAVFVLLGNHEFYYGEYGAIRATMRTMCEELTAEFDGLTTVYLLDQDVVDLPDTSVRVIGCTLWSHVGPASEEAVGGGLSDYASIRVVEGGAKRRITVADTNHWHASQLAWLQAAIGEAEAAGRQVVVMTHHAPSMHGTGAPAHVGSSISSGFATALEPLLRAPILAWLFGHTHWSSWQSYRIGGGGSGSDSKGGSGSDSKGGSSSGSKGASGSDSKGASWRALSGGLDQALDQSELVERSQCNLGEQVLVASNQLGYAAKGEHAHGAGSRCHPFMTLEISSAWARLRCPLPSGEGWGDMHCCTVCGVRQDEEGTVCANCAKHG
jgi:uncharacterized membrane protein YgcG